MIAPKDARIFDEQVTFVEIDDEAAGEFVKISQINHTTTATDSIQITKEEWPAIRNAVDKMIGECRE